MSSPRNMKLAALMASSLVAGCVTEANLGESELLDVDARQTVVGPLIYVTSATLGDLNGDGFDDLTVWTNEGQAWEFDAFVGQPMLVYVYYGRATGLPENLGPWDSDATLSVLPGEVVKRVEAQDLDGDGAAELIIHATVGGGQPHGSVDIGSMGSVHVVPGGARLVGRLSAETSGSRTPSYPVMGRRNEESPMAMSVPHEDLDGVAGAEYLTQFEDHDGTLPSDDPPAVYVRSLGTGELRAKLTVPAHGTIQARAVVDFDADGHADVVTYYDYTTLDPLHQEFGIGVFYGPITGDLVLGDPGTEARALSRVLPRTIRDNLGVGAEHRTVVGRFDGDDHPDLLLVTLPGGTPVVHGGSRANPNSFDLTLLRASEEAPSSSSVFDFAMPVPGRGAEGNDAVFLMGDVFGVMTPGAGAPNPVMEAFHNSAERPMGEGAPRFTAGGSAVGDIDGNGVLDIVLATRPPDVGSVDTRVHVLYDFGG